MTHVDKNKIKGQNSHVLFLALLRNYIILLLIRLWQRSNVDGASRWTHALFKSSKVVALRDPRLTTAPRPAFVNSGVVGTGDMAVAVAIGVRRIRVLGHVATNGGLAAGFVDKAAFPGWNRKQNGQCETGHSEYVKLHG